MGKEIETITAGNGQEQSMIDDDNGDFFATIELPKENTNIESSQHFSNVPPIKEMEMKTCKELKSDNLQGGYKRMAPL